MSDHEVSDADEWEEGNLPSISAAPPDRAETFSSVTYKPSLRGPSDGYQSSHAESQRLNYSSQQYTQQAVTARQPFSQPPVGPRAPANAKVPRPYISLSLRTPGKEAHDRGDPAAGFYHLQRTWDEFKDRWSASAEEGAKVEDDIDSICRRSGAYIPLPNGMDTQIRIWGDAEAFGFAKTLLTKYETFTYSKKSFGKGKWSKMHALDGRVEDRTDKRAREENLARLNREVDGGYEASNDYWLLWPEVIDIDYFKDRNSKVLDELRDKFEVLIDFNTSLPAVRVRGDGENAVTDVVRRLYNLVKEMVNQETVVRILLNMPSSENYRSRMHFKKGVANQEAVPVFFGNAVPMAAKVQHDTQCTKTRRTNRRLVSNEIEDCLKRLTVFQKHVRMRAHLCTLVFLSHRQGDSFSYEEFKDMLTDNRIRLAPKPLEFGPAIFSELDSNPALNDPIDIYTVHFDFDQPVSGRLLRLEMEWTIRYQPSAEPEAQISSTRWLEFPPRTKDTTQPASSFLELYNLDFEKSDWWFDLSAVDALSPEKLPAELARFRESVGCEPSQTGLNENPRQRVTCLQGNKHLKTTTEIETRRYRYKKTSGHFDVSRRSQYKNGTRQKDPEWHTTYFYPEWDNLLSAFASLQPGETPSWNATLPTFFPDKNEQGVDLKEGAGFRNFMMEVAELQGLLIDSPHKTRMDNSAKVQVPQSILSTDGSDLMSMTSSKTSSNVHAQVNSGDTKVSGAAVRPDSSFNPNGYGGRGPTNRGDRGGKGGRGSRGGRRG